MVKVQLMPLYDKIVVEIDDKQDIQSATGLTYTKDMSLSKNTTMAGKVVSVGCGRLMADGTLVPLIIRKLYISSSKRGVVRYDEDYKC